MRARLTQTRASILCCLGECDPVMTVAFRFLHDIACFFALCEAPVARPACILPPTGPSRLEQQSLFLPVHHRAFLGRELGGRQARRRPRQPNDADHRALAHRAEHRPHPHAAAGQARLADDPQALAATAALRRLRLHSLQCPALHGPRLYQRHQRRHRAGRHPHADLRLQFRHWPNSSSTSAMR